MNDVSEYSHYLDAIRLVISDLVPDVPPEILTQLFQQMDQLVRNAVYISSWCEYSDDFPEGSLQMWRSYGNSGQGVAAVIDSSQLQPSVLTEAKLGFFVQSSKVQYLRTDDVKSTAAELLKRIRETEALADIPNFGIAITAALIAKAPSSKHRAFHEEKEIRFLAFPRFSEAMGRYFPSNAIRTIRVKDQEKEFFALSLANWERFDFDLRLSKVLRKVLIGPLGEPKQREVRVRQKLDELGLDHVPTEIVDIPLRP